MWYRLLVSFLFFLQLNFKFFFIISLLIWILWRLFLKFNRFFFVRSWFFDGFSMWSDLRFLFLWSLLFSILWDFDLLMFFNGKWLLFPLSFIFFNFKLILILTVLGTELLLLAFLLLKFGILLCLRIVQRSSLLIVCFLVLFSFGFFYSHLLMVYLLLLSCVNFLQAALLFFPLFHAYLIGGYINRMLMDQLNGCLPLLRSAFSRNWSLSFRHETTLFFDFLIFSLSSHFVNELILFFIWFDLLGFINILWV